MYFIHYKRKQHWIPLFGFYGNKEVALKGLKRYIGKSFFKGCKFRLIWE